MICQGECNTYMMSAEGKQIKLTLRTDFCKDIDIVKKALNQEVIKIKWGLNPYIIRINSTSTLSKVLDITKL